MLNTTELKQRFDSVAVAHRFSTLSDPQWELLIVGENEQGLGNLSRIITAAANGSEGATTSFKSWHRAVRLADTLRAHGFPGTTKRQAKELLDEHGLDRVANAATAMIDGNREFRQQITVWLNAIRVKLGDAPAPSERAAAQGSPTATAGDSHRFNAVPPPPGVHTGQVRMAEQGAAAVQPRSAAPVQPRSASVTTLRQADRPTAPQHHDPRDADHHHESSSRSNAPSSSSSQDRPRQSAPAQGAGDPPRVYDQHSCYGKDVAVSFDCLPNKERTANTVMLKVAKAKGATCKQGVDWDNGILINLEPHEVQTVTAVLLGYGDRVRYAGHGRDNQKWFEFQESTGDFAGAIRLTVAHGSDKRSVNIGSTDVGEVLGVFMRAACSQLKVAPALLPTILRRSFDLYQKNDAKVQARRASAPGGGGQRQASR